MKQLLLSFRLMAVVLLMAFGTDAMAKDFTYDFMSSIPNGWTASKTPNAFEQSSPSRGSQFTTSSDLTLKGAKNVTKIVVTCSSNIADKNTLSVSVAGKAFGETVTFAKETNVEKTFSGVAATGDIVLSITRAEKSVYISKVVITADEISGSGDSGEGGGSSSSELDPNYSYGEPTTLLPTGIAGSNAAYGFVQNNILVEATTGGQTETYFGCNAGNSISFTATKNIKAVVVNGYVKKDFSATASSGEIMYVDASEDYVENDPVLAVLDVNSKKLTINCDKQLRCYSVEIYFDENPNVDLETGDDEEYNFDYEPDAATTLNITFTDMEADDYSDFFGFYYTDLYFMNDDYEMEVAAFAPFDEETVLAPGTYEINDSYEDGTVQASPGGDDMYDYPTYIATGFVYDEEYDEWTYTKSYYIVSGTLTVSKVEDGTKFEINGKTAKGSTVNATYLLPGTVAISNAKHETTSSTPSKRLLNGRVVIVKKDKVYDAAGRREK